MDTPAQRLLPADSPALADLLRTGQVRRAQQAQARPSPPPLSIGVPGLDAALGGGLSRGQLHEIVAPPSAGGTASRLVASDMNM